MENFMTQFNLSGLKKILNPSSGKRNVVDQITDRLSKSSIGLSSGDDTLNAVSFSGMDAFDLTQNISELLSPACGMTEEEKQAELARIQAKLKSGKKLTEEEMRFLQAVDPQLYMQAARIQAMRDSLEQQLEHCKSKEEAAKVFSDTMSMVSDKDPMKEYIVAAYQDAYNEFQKSGNYQHLPQKSSDDNKSDPLVTLNKPADLFTDSTDDRSKGKSHQDRYDSDLATK
jgi:DNA-binding protein YbaB